MEQICILFYNLFKKKKLQLVWLCKHLQPIIINNAKHKKIKFVGLCQCKPENSVDLIKIEGKKKPSSL